MDQFKHSNVVMARESIEAMPDTLDISTRARYSEAMRFLLIAGLMWGMLAPSARAGDLFLEDFSRAKLGSAPSGLLVLGGEFSVKQAGKERFLELAGKPLDLHAVMFGPARKDGVAVKARVFGLRKGRRSFPAFGVGLNGVSGYRLMVSPAKEQLELFKGDDIVKAVPFAWKPDRWTRVRLQCQSAGDVWTLAARVWPDGGKEPAGWSLSWKEKEPPLAGRATIWGAPYAGTPILFDDLKVIKLKRD